MYTFWHRERNRSCPPEECWVRIFTYVLVAASNATFKWLVHDFVMYGRWSVRTSLVKRRAKRPKERQTGVQGPAISMCRTRPRTARNTRCYDHNTDLRADFS